LYGFLGPEAEEDTSSKSGGSGTYYVEICQEKKTNGQYLSVPLLRGKRVEGNFR
jgi:hypothetical protein